MWTSLSSRTTAYSAKVPEPTPYTSSPGANRVTPGPTVTTTPDRSRPGTGCFGRRSPNTGIGRSGGVQGVIGSVSGAILALIVSRAANGRSMSRSH